MSIFRHFLSRQVLSVFGGCGGPCLRPAQAAEQNPQLEIGPARPVHPLSDAIAATLPNRIYVLLRFAFTTAAAVLGGCVAVLNGGNLQVAAAVRESANGETFLTPSMLHIRRAALAPVTVPALAAASRSSWDQ